MKIRSIVTACATSLLVLSSVNAANEVYLTMHGSACQATSLSQAANLGASWSAKGVKNLNSVGSDKSFFVVCPMVHAGLNKVSTLTPSGNSDHYVYPTYQDLTTKVAECTFRRYRYDGTLLKSVTGVPEKSTPNADSADNYIRAAALFDRAGPAIQYGAETVSVVCAVNPQTTITGIASFAPDNETPPE